MGEELNILEKPDEHSRTATNVTKVSQSQALNDLPNSFIEGCEQVSFVWTLLEIEIKKNFATFVSVLLCSSGFPSVWFFPHVEANSHSQGNSSVPVL